MSRDGTFTRKSPDLCMVTECERKALYRCPSTRGRGGRGYCAAHKALAVTKSRDVSYAELSESSRKFLTGE
jgi:hypothetical protein